MYSRLGKTRVIGREIQVFEETTSTNDVVARLARGGVKEGVVVFAESQTKGRGRLGRRWISPPRKGLWFSVLLRPHIQPQAATQLTIASATALARAITLQTGTPEPAFAVPDTALNDSVLGRYVFVLQPAANNGYTLKTVYVTEYGQTGNTAIIATTGLTPGEQIVALGGFKLTDGAAVTPQSP